MADKPPSKPDLKSKLEFGRKSLMQKKREAEEQARREEEEARRQAEEEARAEAERQRAGQFSLMNGGPQGSEEWHAEALSDEALDELTAPPKAGRTGRLIAIAVIGIIVLSFTIATGYYFGRAFMGRAIENAKIEEARDVLDQIDRQRKRYFDAIEAHRKEIANVVRELDRKELDPRYELRTLMGFLDHCATFMQQNQPLTVREVFGPRVHNEAVVGEAVAYMDALNRLFMATEQMIQERNLLALIGTGEEDDEEEPEPRLAWLVYESDPRGDEIPVPWNMGEFVQLAGEIEATELAPARDGTPQYSFSVPVVKAGEPEPVEVSTDQIVEIDAWPIIRREEGKYRMALLARAKGTLEDLRALSEAASPARLRARLEEYATKELYFTF